MVIDTSFQTDISDYFLAFLASLLQNPSAAVLVANDGFVTRQIVSLAPVRRSWVQHLNGGHSSKPTNYKGNFLYLFD